MKSTKLEERRRKLIAELRATNDPKKQYKIKLKIDKLEEWLFYTQP